MLSPVIFVANRGYALSNSRTRLIQHFLESGRTVVLVTADDEESRFLCQTGAVLEPVEFSRGGFSLYGDVRTFWLLSKIYRKWSPALVHHFHAKPVILGSMAAKLVFGKGGCVVNTITGLGHAFDEGVTRKLASIGYGGASSFARTTIFQNKDDKRLFLEKGWVENSRASLIASSGVDLEKFSYINRQQRGHKAFTIMMLSRLLWKKGIQEFIEIAKRIRLQKPGVRFLLAGEEDPLHPDAIDMALVRESREIEYLGRVDDVRPLLTGADLFLFPSHYREGVPRAILEAAATGLPVVAFDVPGVREAVIDNRTGFLVADRDLGRLTNSVRTLLDDKALRLRMGLEARRFVQEYFDIRIITTRYLQLYADLGVGSSI